jgi:glycopeptide antibiotics resistance protein
MSRRPGAVVADHASALALALRVAYAVVIAIATLANADLSGAGAQTLEDVLQPVVSGRDFVDAVRNVVLFAGWGAVWVATAPPGAGMPMLRNAVITGAALSALVETVQFFSDARHASVLDVLSNTAGAVGGAVVVVIIVVFARVGRGRRSFVGIPAALIAVPYACVVLLEAFGSQFRQERLPRMAGGPITRLLAAIDWIDPGSIAAVPWFDLVLFAPAGALLVAMLFEFRRGYRAAALAVAVLGSFAMIAAEFARGAAGYVIAWGPAVAHAAGLALGGWAAALALPSLTVRLRGAQRPRAFLAAYGVLLAAWFWRPFYPEFALADVTRKLTLARFIPLHAYLERVDLFTAIDVLISFLLFLPVGALLAVWPLRVQGALRGLLPGLYLAALVEVAQIALAGRWFDITDMLVHAAAVALGWAVVRRAGYRPYGRVLPATQPVPRAAAAAAAGRRAHGQRPRSER